MNKKYPFIWLTAVILTIGAVFLYLNFTSSWQEKKYAVTIAVSKSPLSAPFYVAQSINAFDNTCVSVDYDEVIGGQLAFLKVINSEVDFGTSSDSVMAFQSIENENFVTHAVFVQSDNDVKLISRLSANVNSPIDLKGMNIGVTKGSASEYFLSTLLAIEGLSIEDINLIHYPPEQLIQGLSNHEVDAVVPWEPFVFEGVEQLQDQIKIHHTKNLSTLSFNLLSKKADNLLVEKAACVIQGLKVAIDYIASNPEESKKIIIEQLNLSPAFIDWVWPDYIFKLSLNQSLILSIESQAKWAIEMKKHKQYKPLNFNSFVDIRAMLRVKPQVVNIPL